MYTLYKFHFLNGISEINQLFDDILIIWPAPVYLNESISNWMMKFVLLPSPNTLGINNSYHGKFL